MRDWSVEGARERDPAFACLLRTLEGLYPDRLDGGNNNASAPPARVLVPGAGSGRLGYEVEALGGELFLPSPLSLSPDIAREDDFPRSTTDNRSWT